MEEEEKVVVVEARYDEEPKFNYTTMIGAGLIGAAISMLGYYTYTQLNDETKKAIKDSVVKMVRSEFKRISDTDM